MIRRVPSIFVVSVIIQIAGCSRGDPNNLNNLDALANQIKTGANTIQIDIHGGGTLYAPLNDTSKMTVNDLSVVLKNGTLEVDAKTFGRLKQGDKVKVEKGGTVFVNGVERPPDGP